MKSIANVTPIKMLSVIPDEYKGKDYVKLKSGDEKKIVKVAYSVYPAKDKEGAGIFRKDGSVVFRTTAYMLFSDGTYSTTKYDLPISQLVSETGMYDDSKSGVTIFDCDCPVRACDFIVRMGNKDVSIIAFEPM